MNALASIMVARKMSKLKKKNKNKDKKTDPPVLKEDEYLVTDRYGFINKKQINNEPTNWPWKRIFKILFITGFILTVIGLAILAGYLSWNEFASNTKGIRIFKTIMASFFSLPYLTYYIIMKMISSKQFKQASKQTMGITSGLGMLAQNYIKNARNVPRESLSGWQVEKAPIIVKK